MKVRWWVPLSAIIAAWVGACIAPLLGCRDQGPVASNVAGTWAFAGLMAETTSLVCADTLTMIVAPSAVTARAPDWHFSCGGSASDTTPLIARGAVAGDSVTLRWTTDSTHPTCPLCWEFTTVGSIGDTVMSGRYWDWLGGVGRWAAVRQ